MQYIVTELDKTLIQQKNINTKIQIVILSNENKTLGVLTGVPQIGEFMVDANSDIRRTTSLDIKLDDFYNDIEEKIESYLNLNFLLKLGIKNLRTDEYVYYRMGVLIVTSANTAYDAVTNTLSIDLSDQFAKLDGTRNGQVGGAPTITIPVEDGGVQNSIKNATINIIKSETDIKDYIIDDIGEYYGMPQNNDNYLEYRKLNPLWNVIPHDLEFSPGNTVADLLIAIRDLYPNCQLYYDIYGNLCFEMIPSNNNSPIILSNDYLQSILLSDNSEDVQYDISSIKNVIEIFGKIYEVDRFSENTVLSGNTFNIALETYEEYKTYDMIAFEAPAENPANSYININEIGNIPLYNEYTTNSVPENSFAVHDMVVIRIMRDLDGSYIAYYLGQYQPHALCVLTDNANDPIYTKSYFANKYNCLEKNVVFVEVRNSPFSIQRLGEILDSKIGDEYDNILSDSVAIENAKYLIYKSSVWIDTVTINTKLVPWLDVNIKVEYKKQQENEIYTYMVKSVNHNFSSGTSSITMHRFSSLYQE